MVHEPRQVPSVVHVPKQGFQAVNKNQFKAGIDSDQANHTVYSETEETEISSEQATFTVKSESETRHSGVAPKEAQTYRGATGRPVDSL